MRKCFNLILLSQLISSCGNRYENHLAYLSKGSDASEIKKVDEIIVSVEVVPSTHAYRFTNHSNGSIWVVGNRDVSGVMYHLQERPALDASGEAHWQDAGRGWCGTGMSPIEIKDGQIFDINPQWSFIRDQVVAYRVGLSFYRAPGVDQKTVFGPEILIR